MAALRGGLSRVVALELLHPFDECELEWLVGGLPRLDPADWRRNTVYKAGYTDQVAIIIWFWQVGPSAKLWMPNGPSFHPACLLSLSSLLGIVELRCV